MRSHPVRLVRNTAWVVWTSSPFPMCFARIQSLCRGPLRAQVCSFWVKQYLQGHTPSGPSPGPLPGPFLVLQEFFLKTLCAVRSQPPMVPSHLGRLQPAVLQGVPPPCTVHQAFEPFHLARKSLSTTGLDFYIKSSLWEFPSGPVVKTLPFQCRGRGGESKIPYVAWLKNI